MSTFHVAMFVKAKTPEDLILEMIKNNNKGGITYKYHSIIYVNKMWYAWYNGDSTKMFKNKLSEIDGRRMSTENN